MTPADLALLRRVPATPGAVEGGHTEAEAAQLRALKAAGYVRYVWPCSGSWRHTRWPSGWCTTVAGKQALEGR